MKRRREEETCSFESPPSHLDVILSIHGQEHRVPWDLVSHEPFFQAAVGGDSHFREATTRRVEFEHLPRSVTFYHVKKVLTGDPWGESLPDLISIAKVADFLSSQELDRVLHVIRRQLTAKLSDLMQCSDLAIVLNRPEAFVFTGPVRTFSDDVLLNLILRALNDDSAWGREDWARLLEKEFMLRHILEIFDASPFMQLPLDLEDACASLAGEVLCSEELVQLAYSRTVCSRFSERILPLLDLDQPLAEPPNPLAIECDPTTGFFSRREPRAPGMRSLPYLLDSASLDTVTTALLRVAPGRFEEMVSALLDSEKNDQWEPLEFIVDFKLECLKFWRQRDALLERMR